jgi:carbonic anhydrase
VATPSAACDTRSSISGAACGSSSSWGTAGAVDVFLEPAGYLPLATNEALRGILDRQLIAVQASARKLAIVYGSDVTKHRRYRLALIETPIATNAVLAAYTVQHELGGPDPHGLRAVYGIYLLDTYKVWAPPGTGVYATGLAEPPADLASFFEFGDAIVRSDRISSLLTSP